MRTSGFGVSGLCPSMLLLMSRLVIEGRAFGNGYLLWLYMSLVRETGSWARYEEQQYHRYGSCCVLFVCHYHTRLLSIPHSLFRVIYRGQNRVYCGFRDAGISTDSFPDRWGRWRGTSVTAAAARRHDRNKGSDHIKPTSTKAPRSRPRTPVPQGPGPSRDHRSG